MLVVDFVCFTGKKIVGSDDEAKVKKEKKPRPPTARALYIKAEFDHVKAKYALATRKEVMTKLGEIWKSDEGAPLKDKYGIEAVKIKEEWKSREEDSSTAVTEEAASPEV
jgi:hypothetical protein